MSFVKVKGSVLRSSGSTVYTKECLDKLAEKNDRFEVREDGDGGYQLVCTFEVDEKDLPDPPPSISLGYDPK